VVYTLVDDLIRAAGMKKGLRAEPLVTSSAV